MADTEEEGPFLAIPQGKQRCTRLTDCQKADCLTCNQPGTGTNHVRNLSQELETTPIYVNQMADTEEEGPFPATTPQGEQRCMRLTGCQKAECLTCNQSGTGTNHVWNLSQELGTTPPPKKTKPPAPADHIISILMEEFEQAFLDDETEDVKFHPQTI